MNHPMRSINPLDGSEVFSCAWDSAAELEEKLDAASVAQREWRHTDVGTRAASLAACATLLRDRARTLAELATREMGKPLHEAMAEVEKCALCVDFYVTSGPDFLRDTPAPSDATSSYIRFDPLGCVLGVMPWNFPYWQALRFAIPTLLSGNAVWIKPAPNVPGCARALQEIFTDAGIPAGTFQTLMIDHAAIASVISDPRCAAVSLTGSTGAGRAVAELAGRALKPLVLELGGADPFIILPDAPLDAAIDTYVRSRTINGGQSCIAAKRLIVHADVHDQVRDGVAARFAALRVGDPMQAQTDIGPLAATRFAAALRDQVQRSVAAGARICAGKLRGDATAFFDPIVLENVAPGMPAFDDELFGPVASIIRAADLDSALTLANRSTYGLGATVWSSNDASIQQCIEALNVGHVAINGLVKSDPRLPFGGIRDSGYGRELGAAGARAFTNAKTVWIA